MKTKHVTLAKLFLPLMIMVVAVGPERLYWRALHELERDWLIVTARLVDAGGHRLHLERQGTGSPTVVFDAGLCQGMQTWDSVAPEVAEFTSVFTYDRTGQGCSDPDPAPRTSQQSADELHALLTKTGVPAPYVLVAHSSAALNARLFASQHPDQVAGMVFIEAAHEEQYSLFAALLPPDERTTYLNHEKAGNCEKVDLLQSAAQVRASDEIPPVPCVVLTSSSIGWPADWPAADLERIRLDLQADLARHVLNCRHIIAEQSGHFIHWDQPDLVIDAIRTVVEEARRLSPPPRGDERRSLPMIPVIAVGMLALTRGIVLRRRSED